MEPRRSRERGRQLGLLRRGGARDGAGRKPNGERALAPRDARPALTAKTPVLVTIRVRPGVPNLRSIATLPLLHRAISAASSGSAFRIAHGSIQSNHVHLIVEAQDAPSLARGMCGFLVRVARGLNGAWSRRGKVLADRYHARALHTPLEVRRALTYVLHNARKHGCGSAGVDPYTSGPWFDGWEEPPDARDVARMAGHASPFAPAVGWLLRVGWRRHGLIRLGESPQSSAKRAPRRSHFERDD